MYLVECDAVSSMLIRLNVLDLVLESSLREKRREEKMFMQMVKSVNVRETIDALHCITRQTMTEETSTLAIVRIDRVE